VLLRVLLLVLLAPAPPAHAQGVETPADLEALEADGLGADGPGADREALEELLREGVDLRTASRDALLSLPGLSRADAEALRAAGDASVLPAGQAARLAPFLLPPGPDAPAGGGEGAPPQGLEGEGPATSARVRVAAALAPGEALPPPAVLQGALRAAWPGGPRLGAGVVLAAVRRPQGAPAWHPAQGAYAAPPPVPTLALARLHAGLRWGALEVHAGDFRAGFAQRLTFDTTGRAEPEGLLPDASHRAPRAAAACAPSGSGEEAACATGEWTWGEGLRGLALRLHSTPHAPAPDAPPRPDATLSAAAFASLAPLTPLASELAGAAGCAGAGCPAPRVEVAGVRAPGARLAGQVELATAGGHLGLHLAGPEGDHARLGVTGFLAAPRWTGEGPRLDFRPSARLPAGGPFGAVGVEGALALGALTALGEVARSFDGAPGGRGGDFAALGRLVHSRRGEELEVALRALGPGYDNPYAHPHAAADEVEGLRARDEAGARLAGLTLLPGDWLLRATADAWRPLSALLQGAPGVAGRLRVEGPASAPLVPLLQLEGLQPPHRPGTAAAAGGPSLRGTARLEARPAPALSLALHYRHALAFASAPPPALAALPALRHGARVGADVALRPLASLRLAARVRWEAEDLAALRPGLTASLALEAGGRRGLRAHARWELASSPPASSTPASSPPASAPSLTHRFRVELEARW
jgi:hypothetical protein